MFELSTYETIETDVLIVGGGGAGCRAAIEAHDQGVDVLMIVKGRLGHSGCTLNVGTSAVVGPWGDAEDTDHASMRDLLAHGGFLGNQELVKVLVEESRDRVREMQEWGIDFVRDDDGSIAINRSAAHTYPRNFAFKPMSPGEHDYGYPPGMAMMDVLMSQMRERGIRVMNDLALVDLLTAGGRVVGATALDCQRGGLVVLQAKSTVLATGTYSQVYSATTVAAQETGDGQAAAYRVGAELIDMEGSQFVAASSGYRPGAIFLNANGERFLDRYGIQSLEGVDKEALCYAVWKEIREGRGTERQTIFIDMTAVLRDEDQRSSYLPQVLENIRKRGSAWFGYEADQVVDPTKEPVESTPLAHTTTGGVRINARCETTVPGLYAAGAVAGGVYGHARPEGYTSMITLVFGRRAGLFAAHAAKEADGLKLDAAGVESSMDRAKALIESPSAVSPDETKARIQAVMREHAWVIKDEDGLREGLRQINQIKETGGVSATRTGSGAGSRDGDVWMTAVEVPNLLLTSELMLTGSLERKESRGAFFRDDYPDTDNEGWLKNIIYRQVDCELVMDTVPVELKYCGPEQVAAREGG